MRPNRFLPIILMLILSGCSTVYYETMEKMGVHKRDIMVDRVQKARDAQDDAKKRFQSALEQFKSVVRVQGGDLEDQYNRLNATLKRSEAGAAEVRDRIRAVEDVSEALFAEWREEIKRYSNQTLQQSSQKKYDLTRKRYSDLIGVMKKAESRLEPALVPLRDQVMFMKHNLNARAIAGLSGEVAVVQTNVNRLVSDMEAAIAEADRFIITLKEE